MKISMISFPALAELNQAQTEVWVRVTSQVGEANSLVGFIYRVSIAFDMILKRRAVLSVHFRQDVMGIAEVDAAKEPQLLAEVNFVADHWRSYIVQWFASPTGQLSIIHRLDSAMEPLRQLSQIVSPSDLRNIMRDLARLKKRPKLRDHEARRMEMTIYIS